MAKAPYEAAWKDAAAQLAVLDALGEENLAVIESLWRLGREREALALREQLLAEAGRTELALAS